MKTTSKSKILNEFLGGGITLLFIFTLAGDATPQPCVSPPDGLVSWWPMDGFPIVDIANGNNPSAVSALSFVPGQVASGVSFGSGGFIEVPHSANLAIRQFTMDAWARPDGPGPNNDEFGSILLGKGLPPPTGNIVNSVALWWSATDNRFSFGFGNIFVERIVSTNTFPPGSFYHVAATYDGTTFQLYVNGTLEGQLALAKTITYDASQPWVIGSSSEPFRSVAGFPRTWNGIIDEVEIFNRALSEAEIQDIFNAGSAGKCKGNQPPAITSLTAAPNVLWPPNHRMVPVSVAVAVSDSSDPSPVCQISGVTSNEPISPPGWVVTGPLVVLLQADRAGQGTGRLYTITVACTNASHLSATKNVIVRVPHDQRR